MRRSRGPDAHRVRRHADRVVADLVARYGRAECIRRRWHCDPRTYDRLRETYGSLGVLGGAGAWITNDDGEALLVRYEGEDAWSDPGTGLEADESLETCARRAAREDAGVDCTVTGLAQVHLLYADDATGRDPLPRPFALFLGRYDGGSPEPVGDGVAAARWWTTLPEELRYEELRELAED